MGTQWARPVPTWQAVAQWRLGCRADRAGAGAGEDQPHHHGQQRAGEDEVGESAHEHCISVRGAWVGPGLLDRLLRNGRSAVARGCADRTYRCGDSRLVRLGVVEGSWSVGAPPGLVLPEQGAFADLPGLRSVRSSSVMAS